MGVCGSPFPVAQGKTLLVLAQLPEARKATGEAEQSYEQVITLLAGSVGTSDVSDTLPAAQHLGDTYAQFSAFLEREPLEHPLGDASWRGLIRANGCS